MYKIISLFFYLTIIYQIYAISYQCKIALELEKNLFFLNDKISLVQKDNQLLKEQLDESLSHREQVQKHLAYFYYRAVPLEEVE